MSEEKKDPSTSLDHWKDFTVWLNGQAMGLNERLNSDNVVIAVFQGNKLYIGATAESVEEYRDMATQIAASGQIEQLGGTVILPPTEGSA